MKEVAFRMGEIRQARVEGDGALSALKKENIGKGVIGPEGEIYLIDGHHFARSLAEAGIENMKVEIIKDWSHLTSPAQFWEKMESHDFVYLKDQEGRRIRFSQLPRTVIGLQDDPYRSLAWMVKVARGFEDANEPFQEFAWASFFKKSGIQIKSSNLRSYQRAFVEAMHLARSDAAEAAGLTGFRSVKPPKDPCKLREKFFRLFMSPYGN